MPTVQRPAGRRSNSWVILILRQGRVCLPKQVHIWLLEIFLFLSQFWKDNNGICLNCVRHNELFQTGLNLASIAMRALICDYEWWWWDLYGLCIGCFFQGISPLIRANLPLLPSKNVASVHSTRMHDDCTRFWKLGQIRVCYGSFSWLSRSSNSQRQVEGVLIWITFQMWWNCYKQSSCVEQDAKTAFDTLR